MANMWTKEQQMAINKKNANILVSASAGSGKTAVLVERVINKVINDSINIDEILVVTFTNAAAIELKERLLVAIYKALDENPKNLFLKRQLERINRASITTIHAFCLELIRANFHVLNMDPNFEIGDESQSSLLKAQVMEEILDGEYVHYSDQEEESSKLYKVLELFNGKDENLIQSLFKIYSYIQSFAYPFDWLKNEVEKYNIDVKTDLYYTEFGREIYDLSIAELEVVLKRGNYIYNEICGNEDFQKLAIYIDEKLSQIKSIIAQSDHSWDKLYELLSHLDLGRAPSYRGDNKILKEKVDSFRKDVLKGTIENLRKSVYAPSEKILADNKIAYEYIIYLYEFLEKFDVEYNNRKRQSGMIDFNDIEHLALKLLVSKKEDSSFEPSDIAIQTQKKFKEVYTDEYQDTSFVQEAILEAVSGSKNRFMVGDIKQSIYRFRQAMPDIFNHKYYSYELVDLDHNDDSEFSNTKIILAKNFRSRKNVIDSINYIFEKLMSKQNGECDYSDIELLKFGADKYEEKEGINYHTEINVVNLKANEEENVYLKDREDEEDVSEAAKYISELKNFEIEAFCIASRIKKIIHEFSVYDMKEKCFRQAEYRDIVILIRSIKDKGEILSKVLKSQDIPVFSDASSSLFDGDEIKLVLSFLRILDNPYQDIYMVSVMFSIIGKFSLDELVYLKNYNRKSNIYENLRHLVSELSEKEKKEEFEEIILEKIERFLLLLNKFIKYSKIYSVDDLLTKIYKDTNIYYQFALEELSHSKKANLDMLIELAKNYMSSGNKTLSSYIAYIDNLKDKSDTSISSAKMIGENENVVRVMTIHKSKGLEFPVVIIADTTRKYNMMDTSNSITMHHNLGIGINIVKEELGITYPSVIKQAIKNAITKETKSEELRMLYVALTRAKEKLIIFATTKDYEKLKNNTFVMEKENKIEEVLVAKNKSYFENILMALKVYENEERNDIFDINVLNINHTKTQEELVNVFKLSEDVTTSPLTQKLGELRMIDKEKYCEDISEKMGIIKENIDSLYEHIEDTETPSRISVSELKRKENEEENFMNIYQNYDKLTDRELSEDECSLSQESHKFLKPSILCDDQEKYTAVRKGILVHFILENLDMNISSKSELQEYINQLVLNGTINKRDKKYINVTRIYRFLDSNIGRELKQAQKIFREYEFILKDKDISSSVIQGVIDLFYITDDDQVVLVDFKTDRLFEEEIFIKRYKKQLDIYKEAIEKLLKYKVKKTLIYSFSMNKAIEIKE
ncbi:MAG: helicase-exonuclease AddAB subunit AddA [Clostridia bacterium]|nr:helicase-exonuclease AddAB subunit AddA [Clostridia bacterium]